MTFFEQRWPLRAIFGAFVFVFVPLVTLEVVPNFVEWLPYALLFNAVGLGVSHFFITLAVYFRTENLRHFASSPKNVLVYFAVPAFLFVGFAALAALDVRTAYPAFATYFFAVVRLADFGHVGRQSFGVLQILKRRPPGNAEGGARATNLSVTAVEHPRWLRRAENALFIGLALCQWETYLFGGRFGADNTYMALSAALVAALFACTFAAHAKAALRQRALPVPLVYLLLQSISAAFAVFETRLYLVALAMHYVEYHVMMIPRCFATPLDEGRRVDRWFGAVRSRRVVFYALLLAVVVLFEMRNYVGPQLTPATTFLVHVFDGIFVVHYFVEAFIWKFSDPFFGRTLRPLYFGAPPAETGRTGNVEPPRAGPSGPAVGKRPPAWTFVGAAGLLAGAAWFGVPGKVKDAVERRLIDPMHAENHIEWAKELVEREELEEALRHLEEARARAPNNAQARAMHDQLDAFLRARRAE